MKTNKVFSLLLLTLLSGCSTMEYSFNKQQVKKQEFNQVGLKWETQLSNKDYSGQVTNSADLPIPNLILERGLVYTPTTRVRDQIVSGGTGLPQFRAVPESEYYKGI